MAKEKDSTHLKKRDRFEKCEHTWSHQFGLSKKDSYEYCVNCDSGRKFENGLWIYKVTP